MEIEAAEQLVQERLSTAKYRIMAKDAEAAKMMSLGEGNNDQWSDKSHAWSGKADSETSWRTQREESNTDANTSYGVWGRTSKNDTTWDSHEQKSSWDSRSKWDSPKDDRTAWSGSNDRRDSWSTSNGDGKDSWHRDSYRSNGSSTWNGRQDGGGWNDTSDHGNSWSGNN